MTRLSRRPIAPLAPLAALVALVACGGEDGAGAGGADGRTAAGGAIAKQSGPPIVTPTAGGYRGGDVATPGTVRGTVVIDSAARAAAPADTGAASTDRACGGARPADPGAVAHAVVWLSDVKSGKRVPLARRFVVQQSHCQLDPRVTAALAGGALNVKSDDRTTHRLRFTRVGTGEVEATMTQVDEGSIVANDKLLAKPGLFEVRCEFHPHTRGWVAAFDHPYHATPGAKGAFALDSVPPGTYRVMGWHERYGTTEGSVTVAAGQEAAVELRFAGK